MNILDYVKSHSDDTVKVDIVERWESRIVTEGLNSRGRLGAEDYLARYGKGMKAAKAIGFARCADIKGCIDMAGRFWEEAYFLETGLRASFIGTAALVDHVGLPQPTLKTAFNHYPQLLVAVDAVTAKNLVRQGDYGVQEKKDGERVMVEVSAGAITAGNKKSLVRQIPLNVRDALLALGSDFVLDGEMVGATYHVFDLLSVDRMPLTGMPFMRRYTLLSGLMSKVAGPVEVITLATLDATKATMVEALEREGAEGYVIKNLQAPYEAGDGHGTQFKHQFRCIVSVIVGGRNGAKESVEVFVNRTDGDSMRSLGFVTVPGTYPFPKPGEIAEVESLYCHPGRDGKLAQPVFKGVRTDADSADCHESKLRVKVA